MTVPDAIVLVDTKLQEMLDEFGDGVSRESRKGVARECPEVPL